MKLFNIIRFNLKSALKIKNIIFYILGCLFFIFLIKSIHEKNNINYIFPFVGIYKNDFAVKMSYYFYIGFFLCFSDVFIYNFFHFLNYFCLKIRNLTTIKFSLLLILLKVSLIFTLTILALSLIILGKEHTNYLFKLINISTININNLFLNLFILNSLNLINTALISCCLRLKLKDVKKSLIITLAFYIFSNELLFSKMKFIQIFSILGTGNILNISQSNNFIYQYIYGFIILIVLVLILFKLISKKSLEELIIKGDCIYD